MNKTRWRRGVALTAIHLAVAAAPGYALAQPAPVAPPAVEAGPLDLVLNRYADQAGLALSYDPQATRDLRSPGAPASSTLAPRPRNSAAIFSTLSRPPSFGA